MRYNLVYRVAALNRVKTVIEGGGVWTGVSTDRFQYGYDADSNVLYQNNLVNGSWSHLYHANSSAAGDDNAAYDALNRIQKDVEGGTLSASGNNGGSLDTSSVSFGTSFGNDVMGNVSTGSFSFNSANQLTGSGNAYDHDGNMTSNGGTTYRYDAWNHIVSTSGVYSGNQSYQYDAIGRRVYELSYAQNVYFDAGGSGGAMGGNAIEERYWGGNKNQYVWGLMYQNQLVLRDDSHVGGGDLGFTGSGLGRRTYAQQDADWNVTALVNSSGMVVERMYYDAYGTVDLLAPDFTGYSGPNYGWLYGFQGGRVDWVTGLVHFGERDYNTGTLKWMEAEPFYGAYVDGGNLYQAMGDNPVSYADPSGMLANSPLVNPRAAQLAWDAAATRAISAAQSVPGVGTAVGKGALLTITALRLYEAAERRRTLNAYKDLAIPDPQATAALAEARARLQEQDQSSTSSGGDWGTESEPCPQTQGAGNGRKPPDKPKAPAPGRDDRPNRHHRLPQQKNLKEFFESRGLNIEDYTRELPESAHIGPDGIHPRGYNGDWEDWINEHPNASKDDILDFLPQIEKKYGLPPIQ